MLGWLVALAVVLGGLVAFGRTPLASPGVADPTGWWSWAQERGGEEVAFDLLRQVGVGLTGYLLAVTVVGVVASLAPAVGHARFARRLAPGPVRRVLQVGLGLTLASAATVTIPRTPEVRISAADAGGSASPPAVVATRDAPVTPEMPTVEAIPAPTGSAPALRTEASVRTSGAVVHDGWAQVVDDVAASSVGEARPASASGTVPDVGPDRLPADRGPRDGVPSTWTVRSGEHFWSIAEAIVAGRRPRGERPAGRAAQIGEVDVSTYWLRLVAANRARLVDPSNPDLILPGQVFVLPEVAA